MISILCVLPSKVPPLTDIGVEVLRGLSNKAKKRWLSTQNLAETPTLTVHRYIGVNKAFREALIIQQTMTIALLFVKVSTFVAVHRQL